MNNLVALKQAANDAMEKLTYLGYINIANKSGEEIAALGVAVDKARLSFLRAQAAYDAALDGEQ